MSSSDPVLQDLATRCQAASTELLYELDKIAVKGKKSKRQSLRKALKAAWGEDNL